jgi:hypothetical protein
LRNNVAVVVVVVVVLKELKRVTERIINFNDSLLMILKASILINLFSRFFHYRSERKGKRNEFRI